MASSSRRLFGQGGRVLMAAAKSSSATATAGDTATKATAGILKPHPVSPALAKFVGASESSRAGAVKKVWEHIKLHNLQNPSKKTEILCDAKLKTIFAGREQVGMLEISKLLSPHFVKATN